MKESKRKELHERLKTDIFNLIKEYEELTDEVVCDIVLIRTQITMTDGSSFGRTEGIEVITIKQ